MLRDCSCGETLLDTHSKGPRCGAPNPDYRQSRWRVFWPDVDALAGADEGIRLGYWAAFFVATLSAIVAVLGILGASLSGLVDAGLY